MDAARQLVLAALPVLLAAPEIRWADAGDLLTGMAAVWTGDDWTLAVRIAGDAAAFVVLTARALVSAEARPSGWTGCAAGSGPPGSPSPGGPGSISRSPS